MKESGTGAASGSCHGILMLNLLAVLNRLTVRPDLHGHDSNLLGADSSGLQASSSAILKADLDSEAAATNMHQAPEMVRLFSDPTPPPPE